MQASEAARAWHTALTTRLDRAAVTGLTAQNKTSTNKVKGTFFAKGQISSYPTSYQFGAYDNGAYNNGKGCSFHVFTVDGALGRDTIGAK